MEQIPQGEQSGTLAHAQKAMEYCQTIKESINGLCRILDISDDPFNETSRLEIYKAMFRRADSWEQQYAAYIQEQNAALTMEQTM